MANRNNLFFVEALQLQLKLCAFGPETSCPKLFYTVKVKLYINYVDLLLLYVLGWEKEWARYQTQQNQKGERWWSVQTME